MYGQELCHRVKETINVVKQRANSDNKTRHIKNASQYEVGLHSCCSVNQQAVITWTHQCYFRSQASTMNTHFFSKDWISNNESVPNSDFSNTHYK
jgi:hypothetical protein